MRGDGSRPRRRFGQNFLADRAAARRIVAEARISPGEAVLEIGPGRGALTELLLEQAGRAAAVEIDRDLAADLRRRFPPDRLVVLEADVLRIPLADAAAALALPADTPIVVVSNLPYNVSKPVAMKMVRERRSLSRAVLMFQKEVAARITAREGSKEYGPLSVLCAWAFDVKSVFDLPPGAFRPRPKVVSSVTRWTPRGEDRAPEALEPALRACLAAAFRQRRRTLLVNLRGAVPGGEAEAKRLLEAAGIDGGLRPEAVPPKAYVRLAAAWPGEARRA